MADKVENIQLNPLNSVITLAIPIMILLFLDTTYSVIDLYWIKGLGQSAIIAMGYIANAVYALNKIGDGIGRAVNVLVSTAFGAQKREETHLYAQQGLILIFALSIIIPLISIPFIKTICVRANLGIYSGLIYAYLAPLLGFVILSMMNNYFSALLSSEGDTKRPTAIIVAGNLINVILDPVLIFHYKMGMWGAAFATIIGCIFALSLFIYIYYIKKDTLVKVNFKGFKFDTKILKEIIILATPIILDGIAISLVEIIVNYGLHLYAAPVTAFAYVVIVRVQTTFFTPIQGLSKGLCIVTGHLTGARRFIKLKKTIRKVILIGIIMAGVIAAMIVIFNEPLISLFSSHAVDMVQVRNMLMFIVMVIIVRSVVMNCSYIYVGLGKSIYSLYFVIFNLIFVSLFIFIFTRIFHMAALGVFLGFILSYITEAVLMLIVLRKMLSNRIWNLELGPKIAEIKEGNLH